MNVSGTIPRIIVTSGEPAGIGPDLCIELSKRELHAELLVLANKDLLLDRAQQLSVPLRLNTIDRIDQTLQPHKAGELNIYSIPLQQAVKAGMLDSTNASYVIAQLEIATQACVAHQFDAMVTGPVHKGIINQAGLPFTGHTEFLAEKTGAAQPVMMLQTKGLRVALATTHLPLKDVPGHITTDLLTNIIGVIHSDLVNRYSIKEPVIMVCGLNPHAGEGGYLGDEEIRIIEPALKQCSANGIQVIGPLSADTIFSTENLEKADVFLAMYHDQGLPVIKYKGFGETVNVTLGLPIIRTSVDHGTALPLAGTGKADVGSFQHAIDVAIQLAHKVRQ